MVFATGGRLCHVRPEVAKTETPAPQGLDGHLCQIDSISGGCGASLPGTTWQQPRPSRIPHRQPSERVPTPPRGYDLVARLHFCYHASTDVEALVDFPHARATIPHR